MARNNPRRGGKQSQRTSWDPLAAWYDGWVGKGGSHHHQKLAIPAVIELLEPKTGEKILDLGSGQGVLAPSVAKTGASYTGVEVSSQMVDNAKRHHVGKGTFLVGDATRVSGIPQLKAASFDGVVFLLSIQDIDPLEDAFDSAGWAVKPGGRMVLLMTHPSFRIPRQSGWGWDENRKLQYRRVDRYLTPLEVPLKPYPGQRGVSRSYHRPLETYFNTMNAFGFFVERIKEIPTYKFTKSGPRAKAENQANREIPLFLGIRARKFS